MTRLRLDITMSLDGYVAGPEQTLAEPLGRGGESLHQWLFENSVWRARHGFQAGGDDADSRVVEASLASTGAHIMGRRMFSGGSGPWPGDTNANGWWGDDPPFHTPVFVLTHHARAPLVLNGGTTFTFVTDGIASALEQARATACGKDVVLSGGADVVQQFLAAGLVDELQVHIAPLLLGDGVRLFGDLDEPVALDQTTVAAGPRAAHLGYRIGGTR